MSDNLPEKADKNKDLHVQEHLKPQLTFTFNVLLEKEDFVNFVNNHSSSCCPIQFFHDKDAKDKNGLNGLVVTKEPQSREKFVKAMIDITGISDIGLANKLCTMAANAFPGDEHESLAIVLQALHNYKPKNAIEAGLVCQATILEMQGLRYLERAELANLLPHRDSAINAAIKLLRLQHETIEALNRLRRGNEQKIVVQHQNVLVGDGGQAVISSQLIKGDNGNYGK